MPSSLPSHPWGRLVLLGVLLAVAGCGSSKARGIVKGKATFMGRPLTVGTVTLYGKDNVVASGTIDTQGNYTINDAPLGDCKVSVYVPSAPMGGMGRMKASPAMKGNKDMKSVNPEDSSKTIPLMGAMPDNVVLIPEKYHIAENSGLTINVKKGEQPYNLDLKP